MHWDPNLFEWWARRSCMIAAYVCDPRRFRSKHRFWSYCGLVRHHQISDGTIYGSKKARGRSLLKGIFHSTAVRIQTYHQTSALNFYFQEKLLKGIDKRAARVALARKVASIALSVMRNEKVYQSDRLKIPKRRKEMKCINAMI
jgi:transposase